MYSKKGVSGHIEIILSFMIFLAFVSFLLFFVNPIEEGRETTHYLDIAEKAIIENLTTNMTSFSVTVTNPVILSLVNDCFCFPYTLQKGAAIDENGKFAKTKTGGANMCIKPTGTAPNYNKYYKLHISREIDEEAGACSGANTALAGTDYRLGVLNEYKMISRRNLDNPGIPGNPNTFSARYANEYNTLKTDLGLSDIEFNLVIKDFGGTNLVRMINKEPPKSANIMAKDIPIEIINETGGIDPAVMNLQVWE